MDALAALEDGPAVLAALGVLGHPGGVGGRPGVNGPGRPPRAAARPSTRAAARQGARRSAHRGAPRGAYGGYRGGPRGFHGGSFRGGPRDFYGGWMSAGGGRGGGRRSDFRLKHDVALLGVMPNGLGFYRFVYNGGHKAFVGVIAQEVEGVMPEAVFRAKDGYLRVEYGKIGVKFQSYDQWAASGGHVPGSSAPTIH